MQRKFVLLTLSLFLIISPAALAQDSSESVNSLTQDEGSKRSVLSTAIGTLLGGTSAQGNSGDAYPALNVIDRIFSQAERGDWFGAGSDAAIALLGAFGIISPSAAGTTADVGTNPVSPRASTPEEIYERQQFNINTESRIARLLSQSIFGDAGQKVMANQREAIGESNIVALDQIAVSDQAAKLSDLYSGQSTTYAKHSRSIADSAQGLSSTHDVLKQQVLQDAAATELAEAQSKQLSELSKGQFATAAVGGANNSLLGTIADQGQTDQVLEAAQTETQTRIRDEIHLASEYEKTKDGMELKAFNQARQRLYIPGLTKQSR